MAGNKRSMVILHFKYTSCTKQFLWSRRCHCIFFPHTLLWFMTNGISEMKFVIAYLSCNDWLTDCLTEVLRKTQHTLHSKYSNQYAQHTFGKGALINPHRRDPLPPGERSKPWDIQVWFSYAKTLSYRCEENTYSDNQLTQHLEAINYLACLFFDFGVLSSDDDGDSWTDGSDGYGDSKRARYFSEWWYLGRWYFMKEWVKEEFELDG